MSFKAYIFEAKSRALGNNAEPEFQSAQASIPSVMAAIGTVRQSSILDRNQVVSRMTRRLEDSRHHRKERIFLLNFVTFRYPGPGRVRDPDPAVPINLADDEYFAYETAALYDHERGLAFVESGRPGMGPGAIAEYLACFTGGTRQFYLLPRVDLRAMDRARRKKIIKTYRVKMATPPIVGADDHLRGRDAGYLQAFGRGFGAATMDFQMNTTRARGDNLNFDNIWNSIRMFRGLGEEIISLEIGCKANDDEKIEKIDLLEHRAAPEIELEVDANLRNIPQAQRWRALIMIQQQYIRDVGPH